MAPIIVQWLKRKDLSTKQVKINCKDTEDNEVTEYILICAASNPPKFALDSIFEIERLEKRYELHGAVKTEFMIQALGRALQGQFSKKFEDLLAEVNISNAANQANNNQTKWNNLMRDFCKSIFPCGALED